MAAEADFRVMGLLLLVFTGATLSTAPAAAATWCVARSEASEQALQTAMDYACGAGADCAPIQPNGLCYLPNTLQAHASYAFNSYYQRKNNAPDSCSFAGTSTVARTDPSYGSCVYPSSPSSAGGMVSSGGTGTGSGSGTGTGTGTGTGSGTGTGTGTGTMTPSIITPPPPPSGTTPLYGSGTGLTPGTGPVIPDSPLPNASKTLLQQTASSPVTFLLSYLMAFWTM